MTVIFTFNIETMSVLRENEASRIQADKSHEKSDHRSFVINSKCNCTYRRIRTAK